MGAPHPGRRAGRPRRRLAAPGPARPPLTISRPAAFIDRVVGGGTSIDEAIAELEQDQQARGADSGLAVHQWITEPWCVCSQCGTVSGHAAGCVCSVFVESCDAGAAGPTVPCKWAGILVGLCSSVHRVD